jgi:protein tyrosine phosphatase
VGLEHDYINANLILGSNLPGHPKGKYIACQAPLPSTISDFWWMVWQEKSCVIVMLTRFREKGTLKAHQYWPQEVDEENSYGNFQVKLVSQKGVSGICINTLKVTKRDLGGAGAGEQRMIYHLFYSEWPDFGVPKSTKSLRSLISYTNLYSDRGKTDGTSGPIVCHCSAGIGRTGTFVAVHAGIELIEATVIPNVPGLVTGMRSCRSGMIQTDAQYLFVYEALNDHIYQFSEAKRPQRVTSACSVSLAPPKNSSKFCKGRGRSISAVMSKEDMMLDAEESEELGG